MAITRHGLIVITGLICWVFMHLLNRTTVVGRKNLNSLAGHKNVLVITNHLTMIDSCWVTMACIWPQIIWRPGLTPWHIAEEKTFLRGKIGKILSLMGCVFIRRDTGNFIKKLPEILAKLKSGIMIIFPEGSRNVEPDNGRIQQLERGAAILMRKTRAQVLPVALSGAENIMPLGSGLRLFKRMVIVIGPPFNLDQVDQPTETEILTVMKQSLQGALDQARKIHPTKKPS